MPADSQKNKQTDIQTDRHRHAYRNTSHPYCGQSNQSINQHYTLCPFHSSNNGQMDFSII